MPDSRIVASGAEPLRAYSSRGDQGAAFSLCRPMTQQEHTAWYWTVAPDNDADMLAWLLVRWRVDPICFAVEALRIKLMPYQAAILLDLADAPVDVYAFYGLDHSQPKRQVLAPSGHGLGKTRAVAVSIWWMLICHPFSKTLVTAPTEAQITGQLWSEIRKLYRRIKKAWPDIADEWTILGTSISHKNPDYSDWHCLARTARPEKPEALQGAHALDEDDADGQLARLFGEEADESARGGMLIVFEEAGGIDDTVRETLRGALSEPGARMLAPGNPTRADGWFANDMDKTHQYAVHHLDCRQSDRTKTYSLPYRDFGGRLHSLALRGFVDPRYWLDLLAECDGDEDHDLMRKRVRGIKPRSSDEQIILTKWVEAAQAREPHETDALELPVIGIDFGLTSDKHGAAVRKGFACLLVDEWLPSDAPEEITLQAAERAKDLVDTFGLEVRRRACAVIIGDANGVGRGAMETLARHYRERRENGERWAEVIFFNSGAAALDNRRYQRRRDEIWYREGRRYLSDPRCSLPQYPGLRSQLCTPQASEERRIIKVESKQQIRKRTGQPSGNAADALLMTLAVKKFTQEPDTPVAPPPHPSIFQQHFDRLRASARRPRYIHPPG